MLASRQMQRTARGFSMVELMVVLVIMAILAAIIVPSLISTLPQRQLAATGQSFAADIRYCRAKAEASGNTVYLGFVFSPYQDQVEAGLDSNGDTIDPATDLGSTSTYSFDPPANPGVSRTATEYYIVEQRPRTMRVDANGRNESETSFDPRLAVGRIKTVAMTYMDWVNWYYNWNAGSTYADGSLIPYPVEPRFPTRRTMSYATGALDPNLGPCNDVSVPLVAYPQQIVDAAGDYSANFTYADVYSLASPYSGDWGTPDLRDQQFKMFCVADQNEILSYDDNVIDNITNRRYYDSSNDNKRLLQTVNDFVLLKRIALPEHVTFLNPWRSEWVVGYEGPSNSPTSYVVKDLGFIQHLLAFSPAGEITLADWTYEPERFPPATRNKDVNLVHGIVKVIDNLPTIRPVWMVLRECVDYAQPERFSFDGINRGSEMSLLTSGKKANLSASGRMFMLWPLNGKYFVDEYTPNDSGKERVKNDPLLSTSFYASGGGALSDVTPEGGTLSAGAEEFGWVQNFLASPALLDNVQR